MGCRAVVAPGDVPVVEGVAAAETRRGGQAGGIDAVQTAGVVVVVADFVLDGFQGRRGGIAVDAQADGLGPGTGGSIEVALDHALQFGRVVAVHVIRNQLAGKQPGRRVILVVPGVTPLGDGLHAAVGIVAVAHRVGLAVAVADPFEEALVVGVVREDP
jgi:hypothetical protein